MTDFGKMTARSLRELARKVLGPGHSRLRTKAELVRALEEAGAKAAAAPARTAGRVRSAASRAADATGKAVRAVAEAVGKAARSPGKRAGAEEAAAAGKKPAAKVARKAVKGPSAAAKEAKQAPKSARSRKPSAAGAVKGAAIGAVVGARVAAPARVRKDRKVAAAASALAGAAVGAAVGASVGASVGGRLGRRRAPGPRPGPDPDGFFVARVRGEDAVRAAPHPMVEPEPEGDEDVEAAPSTMDEQLGELPWGYGDDAFVALPRDPRTVFLYWDWSPDTMARGFEGLDHPRAQLWILARADAGWERLRTIEFALESRGYYVHDLQPGRTYRAEIHAVDRHGRERLLSHGSNEVALPLVGPSPLVDDRFVRIPWDLPLGRLLGPGHVGAPFSEEARALLARLSDWSRFAGHEVWGSGAGGMGGRPSSPTAAPSSPTGPVGTRER
jgi:uncharacterized protein YcfJ